MTKCTFQKYGPSGTMENVDALCVLPVNVINEKIFFVLWFWFILLACWSIADLGFQTYLMFKPSYRPRFLRWLKLNGMTDDDRMEYRNLMDKSVDHLNWFDWVILYDYGHHSLLTDEWRSISNLLRLVDALFNKTVRKMQKNRMKHMEQRLSANPAFPPIQWVGGKCIEECGYFF
ncbi:innexin shaking-B-like [Tigriopus californicus]|uniref:innexin shaking-B-like n=1 Tax=Tigriopus californicus TaxID=6832 RepID=UPI0027DA4B48|nr:innexin shaking-B-like [Tigriopus californicus]